MIYIILSNNVIYEYGSINIQMYLHDRRT